MLVFQKAVRSCSLTKKLLKILKVAKKLQSRIWKGLMIGYVTFVDALATLWALWTNAIDFLKMALFSITKQFKN